MRVSLKNKILRNTLMIVVPVIGLSLSNAECSSAANSTSGKATVYSDHYSGHKTATGERYKPGAMTAASNKLPLGSKVVVKNRKTGKKVTVRINDRMAKNAKASLDLSKGAASKLGVKGTAPVEAKVVSK